MLLYLKKIAQNKVVKNFSYVTIGNIVAQLLNLVALIKIAKILAPENYGVYTFLTVQAQLIYTIADLGLRNIIIRTIARDKLTTKNVVYTGLIIKSIAVIVICALYFLYNKLLGSLNNDLVYLIFLYAFFYSITNLLESAFWGHQKMFAPAIINVFTSIIWLVYVLAFAFKGTSIWTLFAVFTTIYSLTFFVYFYILNTKIDFTGDKKPFFDTSKGLLKQSWPYFVLVMLGLPYGYLTNNFLDINSSKIEIGYFNLAQKLMSPISLVITFSLSALFPNLSSLWINDQQKFKGLIKKGIGVLFVSALLLCFFYTVFAEYIIKLFFSSKYYPVIKISQMQIWFVFLMGINSVIGTIWGATNNERLLVKSSIINAVISLPILYFCSKYGALGLSNGYVISFSIFEIYLWMDFKKSIKLKIANDLWLWLFAISLFCLSYFLINDLPLILKIVICILAVILPVIYLKKQKTLETHQDTAYGK